MDYLILNEIETIFDDRQRLQSKKIHLQHAEITKRIHRILRDDIGFIRTGGQRDNAGQRPVANHNAGGMSRSIAGNSFQRFAEINNPLNRLFRLIRGF